MRAVAIALDGVLRKPLDVEAHDFGATMLFRSLAAQFRVVVLGTDNAERDEQFLTINGLNDYVRIEPMKPEDGTSVAAQKRGQLRRLRAEGYRFEFVVVPDPEQAKDLYAIGVPVLLYLHPTFSSESFRPDYEGGLRPWNDLVDEVRFQVTARAEQMKERAST